MRRSGPVSMVSRHPYGLSLRSIWCVSASFFEVSVPLKDHVGLGVSSMFFVLGLPASFSSVSPMHPGVRIITAVSSRIVARVNVSCFFILLI